MIKIFLTAMLFSLQVHALDLADFGDGGKVRTYNYEQTKIPEQVFSSDSEKSFREFTIKSTPRYEETGIYVNSQSYLPEYSRKALAANSFWLEYLIQNAHDSDSVLAASEHLRKSELCLYFVYDDSMKFVHNRIFKMLSGDAIREQRLTAGLSLLTGGLKPYAPERIPFEVVSCSAYLDEY